MNKIKNTLFFYLLFFIIGIGLQDYKGVLIACSSLLVIFFINFKRKFFFFSHLHLLYSLLALTGGYGWYTYKTINYHTAQKELLNYKGELQVSIESIEKNPTQRFPYTLLVKIYSHSLESFPFHYYYLIFYLQKPCGLKVGDTLTLSPTAYASITNKECAWYYTRMGILAAKFSYLIEYKNLIRPRYHVVRWIHLKREFTWAALKKSLSKKTFLLFSKIFGGKKEAGFQEFNTIKENFKKWGLSHYLARSGAHLLFLVWFWLFVFHLFPVSFRLKSAFIIIILTVYTLLTWISLSFMRALWMAYITQITKMYEQEPLSLHTINLVTFGTLLCNPFHLFFIDFQLSFGFSYALIFFSYLQHHKRIATKKIF